MPKPTVQARERSPFGDITPEEQAKLAASGKDRWFIEGYSDKRIKRELAIRAGEKAPPLTHRYHLVPVTALNGANLTKGVSEKRQEGYRVVTKDELANLGIKIDNGAYEVMPDGTIRNGDSVLMVCDAKHATANYNAQMERNTALQDLPMARMEVAAEKFNRKLGLDEKTGTSPIFEIEEPEA